MHLPAAPSSGEKYVYVRSNKFFLYTFGIASTLLLLIGGSLFAFSNVSFHWYIAFVLFVAVYLGISYIIGIFARPFDHRWHSIICADDAVWNMKRPSVDVFLPSAGEPLEILENTFRHAWALRWHGKLCHYVLDDSGRQAVKDLSDKYGFTYICRPNRGELKKAGNIRHAFAQTDGDLIVIFDADFCPRPEFLHATVPYFNFDKRTAIVQTPQFFDVKPSMGWVERGAGAIQELFYRLIQVNRDHWQGSICVGTNAVYRRSALKPYGGTYPIQHSEDVHTGFNLVKDGWRLRYIPIVLAKGTCPDDTDAFFNQQYRWAMGSTSLLFNRALFWKTELRFMTRLSYLSGMFYYSATGLGILFTPLPGLLMVWFAPEKVMYYNYAFSLPSFLFGTVLMRIWNRSEHGFAAIRARHISYYAHLFALYDRLRSTAMEWLPTGAVRKSARPYRQVLLFTTVVPALIGFLGCYRHMGSIMNYHFYPYIAFTTFYTILHLTCLLKPRSAITRPSQSGSNSGLAA